VFGPNCSRNVSCKIDFHHRGVSFRDIFSRCCFLFREKFNVSNEFEILPLTGSGTLAVEAFVSSINKGITVDGCDGTFKQRWILLCKKYGKLSEQSGNRLYCRLETSRSIVNEFPSALMIDCVSSFPYYDVPPCEAWVTVSSKLLGATPVLGIVVVKRKLLDEMCDESEMSYLNLNRVRRFAEKNQTPTTPSMALFEDFRQELEKIEVDKIRENVRRNSEVIVNAVGVDSVVGENICPVITIPKERIQQGVAVDFDLYGLEDESKVNYQIFTGTESRSDYERLARAIEGNR